MAIPSTNADGNVKVLWVPAISNPAAPTVAELTAVGVKDLSCYLTSDGWTPGLDEATISDDRLCDTQTYEKPGRSSRSLALKYIENPTDPTNDVAFVTLVPGSTGNFVIRKGLPYTTAIAAAQKVDVWPVQLGQQDSQPPEANSVLKAAQKAFVTGPVLSRQTVV